METCHVLQATMPRRLLIEKPQNSQPLGPKTRPAHRVHLRKICEIRCKARAWDCFFLISAFRSCGALFAPQARNGMKMALTSGFSTFFSVWTSSESLDILDILDHIQAEPSFLSSSTTPPESILLALRIFSSMPAISFS